MLVASEFPSLLVSGVTSALRDNESLKGSAQNVG